MDRPAGDTPKVGAGSWLQMGASKPPPSIAPQLHVLEGSSSPEGLPPRLLLLRFQNVPIFLQRQKVTPSTVGAQAAVWRPTASRTKVLQLLPHRLPAPPPPHRLEHAALVLPRPPVRCSPCASPCLCAPQARRPVHPPDLGCHVQKSLLGSLLHTSLGTARRPVPSLDSGIPDGHGERARMCTSK